MCPARPRPRPGMASPSSDARPSDTPASPDATPPAISSVQVEDFALTSTSRQAPRLPSIRSMSSEPTAAASMTASSTPLGTLNAARRPAPPQPSLASISAGGLPQDVQAKMRAFHLSRQGAPPTQNLRMPGIQNMHSISTNNIPMSTNQVPGGAIGGGLGSPSPITPGAPGGPLVGGPGGFRFPPSVRPSAQPHNSAPAVPNARMSPKLSLAAKRGLNRGMKLSDAAGPLISEGGPGASGAEAGVPHGVNGEARAGNQQPSSEAPKDNSLFSKYSEFVDTKTGTLKFKGKAIIHGKGIEFSSGSSFSISLDEVDNLEELGKGNYGTVYRVRHSRPQMRRPGLGLQGNRAPPSLSTSSTASSFSASSTPSDGSKESETTKSPASPVTTTQGNTTGLVMAMKEIRLELDEAKFAAIIMELDILHRCISPFIIDFYGAFFQEGAVYICMEYMDGGSVDKLYGDGVPEGVLRKITMSTVMGLKALKDEHNIIHRDVKPTNILVNSRGQVKICDFGVSGNLVASIAKTNIGCQSYMAPERIASGGVAQAGANPGGGTYSVQSDIWSLGLSIIECAMGRYPYPPETYNNIFSQLSVSLALHDRSACS